MKKCPFCSEEINDDAKKCRYCGEWLEGIVVNIKKQSTHQKSAGFYKKIKKPLILIVIVLILILILFSIVDDYQRQSVAKSIAKAKSECSQGGVFIEKGKIITPSEKDQAEGRFLIDNCTDGDLNNHSSNALEEARLNRCRESKRTIETWKYDQCLKKKGF